MIIISKNNWFIQYLYCGLLTNKRLPDTKTVCDLISLFALRLIQDVFTFTLVITCAVGIILLPIALFVLEEIWGGIIPFLALGATVYLAGILLGVGYVLDKLKVREMKQMETIREVYRGIKDKYCPMVRLE